MAIEGEKYFRQYSEDIIGTELLEAEALRVVCGRHARYTGLHILGRVHWTVMSVVMCWGVRNK